MPNEPGPGHRPKFAKRLRLGLVVILIGSILLIIPPWILAAWTTLHPEIRRTIAVGFLNGIVLAYGLVFVTAVCGGAVGAFRVVHGRRRRKRRAISARILSLSLSSLLALACIELGSWALGAHARRPPPIPPVPAPSVPSAANSPGELTLLVLGESSAEGQPFEPWFSIGHVLAWQLEKAQPERKVDLVMHAKGGSSLTSVVKGLGSETRRPDVVLLYSGHNEFQARWGWSRTVNYYPEDLRERPRDGIADWVGDRTPFLHMIHQAVDAQRIDMPPIVREIRDVVDRPVCEPSMRERLRADFARDLETLVTWCEQAGSVPILVVPSGNDVGFDPDRSILDPSARTAERKRFSDDFLRVKEAESLDPVKAVAGYRRLIERQPLFAEAHYRLAMLLDAKEDEKGREFETARDLDGLPMRCPSEFQDVYRALAAKHPSVVLVDGPSVLRKLSPTGLLDDHLFHDGQHPSFRAYLALADEALRTLRIRGLFRLAKSAPPISPAECAARFGLDRPEPWVAACRRASEFWRKLAPGRYDETDRLARARRLDHAAAVIERGTRPEEAGVPGLGVEPAGFPSQAPSGPL